MARTSNKTPETSKPGILIYAGPNLIKYALRAGMCFNNGIPKIVPEELHFTFVSPERARELKNDAAFIRDVTAAVKKLKGGQS